MKNSYWIVAYFKDGKREYARFENESEATKGAKRIKAIGASNIYVGKVRNSEVNDHKYLVRTLMVIGTLLWIIVAVEIVHYFW